MTSTPHPRQAHRFPISQEGRGKVTTQVFWNEEEAQNKTTKKLLTVFVAEPPGPAGRREILVVLCLRPGPGSQSELLPAAAHHTSFLLRLLFLTSQTSECGRSGLPSLSPLPLRVPNATRFLPLQLSCFSGGTLGAGLGHRPASQGS